MAEHRRHAERIDRAAGVALAAVGPADDPMARCRRERIGEPYGVIAQNHQILGLERGHRLAHGLGGAMGSAAAIAATVTGAACSTNSRRTTCMTSPRRAA